MLWSWVDSGPDPGASGGRFGLQPPGSGPEGGDGGWVKKGREAATKARALPGESGAGSAVSRLPISRSIAVHFYT